MMHKFEDWWDNTIYNITHIKENTIKFFIGIKRWLSYYKVVSKVFDFDYSSILEVEKYQITRVRDSITKYHSHLYWERDVERMNLALKLLDIIEEDGCSQKIGKDFEFEKQKDGLYKLIDDPNAYWTIPVYVNTRNSKRFWKDFDPERFKDSNCGNLWRDNLRINKAWYLYHKLKFYYLKSWWD